MATVRVLPHGYTNRTVTDGQVVVKTYQGPDSAERQAMEELALRRLAGVLPVPSLLASAPGSTTTAWLAGVPGQAAIDAGHATEVLTACGRLLAELQRVDPRLLFSGSADDLDPGATLVHHDFGPNNVVLRKDLSDVRLLCDWEWVCLGNPLTDLAWAEWIVRAHHPDAVGALGALFDGYGRQPPWAARQAAMRQRAQRHQEFVQRWHGVAGAAAWEARLAAIDAWSEVVEQR